MQSKILIAASYGPSLINFRRELIIELIRRGHEVHVAAPNLTTDDNLRADLQQIGVVAHSIYLSRKGLNPIRDVATLLHLILLVKKIKPQVFFCYTVKPVIYGTIAAKFCKVPSKFALITGRGILHLPRESIIIRAVKKIITIMYRYSLSQADMVIYQNVDDQKYFLEQKLLGSSKRSTVVSGSGVDLIHFSPAPLPAQVAFLFVGRFLYGKGIAEYLEAATNLKKIYPNVKFFIAGWTDKSPDSIAEKKIEELEASGAIVNLGKLADVRDGLRLCSVFVLPSHGEGMPRSSLEALAMGRAIITTDVPGCRETVLSGENGFLVPKANVPALTEAMRMFIQDRSLIEPMGKKSRDLAVRKFDVNVVLSQMIEAMRL